MYIIYNGLLSGIILCPWDINIYYIYTVYIYIHIWDIMEAMVIVHIYTYLYTLFISYHNIIKYPHCIFTDCLYIYIYTYEYI